MRKATLIVVLFLLCIPVVSQNNVPSPQPQAPATQPAAPVTEPAVPAEAPAEAAPPAAEAATPAAEAMPPAAEPTAASPATPAEPAPAGTPAATATPKAVDHVHFVFYRSKRFGGSALEPSIYIDGKQIARMDNGRYFVANLPPGRHGIGSDDKSSAIDVNAKAGTVYFIRTDIETGFWKGHGKLTMMMPEQGSAEYKKCKYLGQEKWIAKEIIGHAEPDWTPEKTE